MKNRRFFITSVIAALLIFIITPALISASNEIDYTKPIPLGAEEDLVSGLSESERNNAITKYNSRETSEYYVLKNILYNFQQNVDEKYYGGSYFDKKDKDNPQLYILVTDMSIIPDIDNDGLHFLHVKYSEIELQEFRAIIRNEFLNKGLLGISSDVKNNKFHIRFYEGTDIKNLAGLIPEDSFTYEFTNEEDIDLSTITVENGEELKNTAI